MSQLITGEFLAAAGTRVPRTSSNTPFILGIKNFIFNL